jgi:hypothetical protein
MTSFYNKYVDDTEIHREIILFLSFYWKSISKAEDEKEIQPFPSNRENVQKQAYLMVTELLLQLPFDCKILLYPY